HFHVARHPANVLLCLAGDFPKRSFHAIFVHSTLSGYFDKSFRELRMAIPIRIPTPTAIASANSGRRPVWSVIRVRATAPSFAASLPSAADWSPTVLVPWRKRSAHPDSAEAMASPTFSAVSRPVVDARAPSFSKLFSSACKRRPISPASADIARLSLDDV